MVLFIQFYLIQSSLAGCFSFALVGYAAGWPSPVLIKMKKHESPVVLDSDQTSWMVSLMYVGHLVSPVPSGQLMDRLGRRQACIVLAVLSLLSWILVWSTLSAAWLYVARFIAGLWAGAVSTIIPVYIGEIAEPRLRSSLTVFSHLMRNFGVTLVYLVGPYISYSLLAMSGMVLTVGFISIFLLMPESPYYLLMKNRNEEAIKSLCWLRAMDESKASKELNKIKESIKEQTKTKGSLHDVWSRKGNRKAFIISQVYAASKRMTGSGVLQAYISLTLPQTTLGYLSPNDCVIILGLISLLSSVASVYLAVKISRRTLVSFSSGGCGITMILVSVWFYLSFKTTVDVTSYSDWLFIAYAVYNASFSLGLGHVGTSVKGELFAANVKAICSSLTTVLVALISFLLNKFFLAIAEYFGMYANFLLYAGSCFFAIIFTWAYVPETQGKTLQEIQNILENEKKKPIHIKKEKKSIQ